MGASMPSPTDLAKYTLPRCERFYNGLSREYGARPIREVLTRQAAPIESLAAMRPGVCELLMMRANGSFWLHSGSNHTDPYHRIPAAKGKGKGKGGGKGRGGKGRRKGAGGENPLRHFERVPIALELLHALGDPNQPMLFNLETGDVGMCGDDHRAPENTIGPTGVVGSSRTPLSASALLLPLTQNQAIARLQGERSRIAAGRASHPLSGRLALPAIWRGAATGYASLQHAFTAGRLNCSAGKTDRHCLRKIAGRMRKEEEGSEEEASKGREGATAGPRPRGAAGGALLSASFKKEPQLLQRYGVVLAVDGNSYATIFKPALLWGAVVVRVGGYVHGDEGSVARPREAARVVAAGRLGFFEWFEPLLVPGEHYVQTTLDKLPDTIRQLSKRMGARAAALADRLFSEEGMLCYLRLAIAHFSGQQAAALREAAALPRETWRPYATMQYSGELGRWCAHYCRKREEHEQRIRGSWRVMRLRTLLEDSRCRSSCRMSNREKGRFQKHLELEHLKNALAFKKKNESDALAASLPPLLQVDEELRRQRCKGMPLRLCVQRAAAAKTV